ncbi:hypothetical protein [Nitrosopumilus adriaticus]|uniref:hypothetical protein n=1 Tax=Nitrosopumilus adriaticus TaxID=1580092 RepID=UPI00352C068E
MVEMKTRLLIIVAIVSAAIIAVLAIGTTEYQSAYNQSCNSDGGYVTGFLKCTYINEDFSDPRITGKMAREICSVTGGECPPNYPANILDDGSAIVGVTVWNAKTDSEKSYVFTIQNNTLSYTVTENDFDFSQISTMQPNSMEFFYYPYPENTDNRDVFQKFVLIRLPEELGGGADDVSAFRAYSAVSISTDHCVTKYWPHEGRQRLEDPCWGTMYRVIDGLVIQNTDPVMITSPMALPYLDLSIDEKGSLYVEPPVWTVEKNGVIGVGRSMSMQEIQQGSQIMADSLKQSNPNHPAIPISFAGYGLAEIESRHNKIESRYYDYSTMRHNGIHLEITNVPAQSQKYFLDLAKTNAELWQIGETVIVIGGHAFDENTSQPERFRDYTIQFSLDGFKYKITGNNLESIKKSIVANFFPEYTYDDLIFVSSTVRK